MNKYRFLTEVDTSAFCDKVTKALEEGWVLYGNPTYAYDEKEGVMRCGQAVTKDDGLSEKLGFGA